MSIIQNLVTSSDVLQDQVMSDVCISCLVRDKVPVQISKGAFQQHFLDSGLSIKHVRPAGANVYFRGRHLD